MENLKEILNKVNQEVDSFGSALAILLIICGILLLHQFLIVIVGPTCIILGAWYLYNDRTNTKQTE